MVGRVLKVGREMQIDKPGAETDFQNWKNLYLIGGIAPLITLTIYLIQLLVIIFSGVSYPTTPEGWFALFQNNTLLGLIFLNAFDVFLLQS